MRLYVCICAYLKIHITKIKKRRFSIWEWESQEGLEEDTWDGAGGGESDNSILIKMCLLKRKKKAKYLFFSGVFSPGQTAAWTTNSNNQGFTSFTS